MISASAAYLAEHAKRARTPIYQVRLFKSGTITPGLYNPSVYWTLDEISGIRADATGGGRDLTDNNTVTSNTGKRNLAAQFTAANSEYLNVDPAGLAWADGIPFFLAAWVYLDSKGADRVIVSKYDSTTGTRSWALTYNSAADRFVVVVNDAAGNQAIEYADSLGSPALATWYFICGWKDEAADTLNIQVNNGPVDSQSTTVFPGNSISVHIRVGAWKASGSIADFWDGRIDEVGVWQTVLTAEQRTVLYEGGIDLLAEHKFCTSHPVTGEDIGLELLVPLELSMKAEVEHSRFPLSTLIFRLYDTAEAATAIIAAGIAGYTCEFRSCFYDIAWAGNAVQRFTGIVTEIEHESSQAYLVTARSPMVTAQDKIIFNGAQTRLSAAITSTDTTVPVVDATGFDSASNLPQAARRHVLVDSEIMTYRGKTATSLTSVIRVGATPFAIPPAFPAHVAAAHSAGAAVRELVGMEQLTADNDELGGTVNDQHPVDYLTTILTNTTIKYGIGLGAGFVNGTELAAVRTALGAALRFRFLSSEGVNGKTFLEDELYRTLGAYPTEDEQGRIGIKLFQTAATATIVGTITDADIAAPPQWVRNAEKLVNVVIVHYDDDVTRDTADYSASTYEYRDETLIALHGRELPLIMHSKGIRSYYTFAGLAWFSATAAFLQTMAQRHIARFGNKSPVIQVQALFSKNLLEVGDDVSVTLSHVPNLDTASKSITAAPFEITAMRHNFETNVIEMQLLGYPE